MGDTINSPLSSWTTKLSKAKRYAGNCGTVVCADFNPDVVINVQAHFKTHIKPDPNWMRGIYDQRFQIYRNLYLAARNEYVYAGILEPNRFFLLPNP